MGFNLRPGTTEDAESCGAICYRAFKAIAEAHNFPPDFPSENIAIDGLRRLLNHRGFFSVVAELDSRIVGSNFLDERSTIGGIGPITVDPTAQNRQIGRRLMEHVIERARSRNVPGVRLVQVAYHNRSLSLYTKLGFESREPLSTMQGPRIAERVGGHEVRPANPNDQDACDRLCMGVHGHARRGELAEAIKTGSATVVEHLGRISGYGTGIGFSSHAVGESNDDLKALISAAPSFAGAGILVPTRNGELMRWCLDHGLRIVQPMTLMSRGLYNEPAGRFLPSILY